MGGGDSESAAEAHAACPFVRSPSHVTLFLFAVVMPAKYIADGTGRDTDIRRDPVECFGKNLYKSEPRLITRMGNAGCAIPRQRAIGVTADGCAIPALGGIRGGAGFERPDRFIRVPQAAYPAVVNRFSTMKEIVQDAYVGSVRVPPELAISGYQGFKPRIPPGVTEWDEVSGSMPEH